MIIEYWLDSGANINSMKRGEISLEELGMTEEEWNAMPDDEKDEIMREMAWGSMDWGYRVKE